MPETLRFLQDLRTDGVAAVVSGAGPTVLAFTDSSDRPGLQARAPDGWQVLALPIDQKGAQISVGD